MRKQLLLFCLFLSSVWVSASLIDPDPILRLSTTQETGYEITVYLTSATGKTYQVDFGNGKEDIYINSTYSEVKGVLNGNAFKLYGDGDAITKVSCMDQELWSVDVSNLPNLEFLNCSRNKLSALYVASNVHITRLWCSDNGITKLNIRNLSKLKELYCGSNELTEIELFRHNDLETLGCHGNKLSALDWRTMPALKSLSIQHNNFTELDFSNNPNLEKLFCRSNNMTRLDVSDCLNLIELNCTDNELPWLYLEKNVLLQELVCDFNNLSALDVSNNPELSYLSCILNEIEELDVRSNPKLATLRCGENKLSKLDISQNPLLRELQCQYNRFTFASLPFLSRYNKYEYTDQQPVQIVKDVAQGELLDLSKQDNIQGNTSNYSWKLKSGESLQVGVDFTVTDGQTRFLTVPSDSVYCEITNPTYPAMTGDKALKTTCVKVNVSTAIDDTPEEVIKVYTANQSIVVDSDQQYTVSVHNVSGQRLDRKEALLGEYTFAVPGNGIYIVIVEGEKMSCNKKVYVR